MDKALNELVEISQYYGKNPDYVLAGGGNTSVKDENFIWVKASGTTLANITESGFVKLDRHCLSNISTRTYNEDITLREAEVKNDLYNCIVNKSQNLRPSVETSMHNAINYKFVVHTHPALINGLLCGKGSKKHTLELFGEQVVYVPYTDPGYILFKKVEAEIEKFRSGLGHDPKIIFLENHGVFVSADTVPEIRELYDNIMNKISAVIKEPLEIEQLPVDEKANIVLPAIRMLLSENRIKVAGISNNSLIGSFSKSHDRYYKVSLPFTPDIIVYCKAKYIYIESTGSAESIIERFKTHLKHFIEEYNYLPKVILIKDIGLIGIGENSKSAETTLNVFEDMMKISYFSESFGGPRFMSPGQIDFIDNWEVENYRRKQSSGDSKGGLLDQKIAIVTGGAQGFGEGIARDLFAKKANVIIADLNEEKGAALAEELNNTLQQNKALFVKTDVSDPASVSQMISHTVCSFGGLDIMISNAGVLKAGSLEEMEPDVFEFVTKVNYSAYFLCAKYASVIMKTQSEFHETHFMDIIQINSKSGLKGSNKNFAYAGGKFGGIGLTQSFALELMPNRIKVNSICPGNLFDGPLWSDPKKGLFIQYLNAGKVPGARSIEDVKKHYENQVPAKRGCRVEDVMKAIVYVIDQQYETGQAIPVTGGQIMLS